MVTEALRAATEAVALARHHDERGNEATALLVLADVSAELDNATLETVEPCYAQARALATTLSMRPVVARCHLGLGRFLRRLERTESAGEELSIAARLLAELGLESLCSSDAMSR